MGLISGLARIARSGTKLISSSANFGKFVGTTAAGSSRVKYLEDVGTFSAVKPADKPAAYKVLTENESLLDDAVAGTKTNDQVVNNLITKLDDAGYSGTRRQQKNLAQKMVSNTMAFNRRKTVFERLGSVAGAGGIVVTGYLICDGVWQAISNALGGALDDILNLGADSNLGVAIVIGSVVIGSVYILRTTKEALGS